MNKTINICMVNFFAPIQSVSADRKYQAMNIGIIDHSDDSITYIQPSLNQILSVIRLPPAKLNEYLVR